MAVKGTLEQVKVVMKYATTSQTIGRCNKSATDEQLYQLGKAVAGLNLETLETITKVEETSLIEQAE